TNQPEPLTQLIVDDNASKSAKRKKKTEAGLISLEISGKEGTSVVADKGEVVEAVQSPSKKRKVSNTVVGEAAKGKMGVVAQPSSSQAVPAALKGDSSSAW
ncbi:hypothetical protein A2U01_0071141, partial [Trifolium medium]|nr:hypothetical protein [Trifolium medium]